MKHVIIGAGPCGVIASETLRKVEPMSTIIMIGDEPEPPYSRMALPYYLINRIDEKGTYLRKETEHFISKNIDIINDRADKLDIASKSVILNKHDPVSYDKLLIATGSRPMKLPIEGIDLPGVHTCWTLEDGRNIARKAKPGSRVLLVGAGFIGCIILEALALKKVDLTVVEMGDRMVPRMMDKTAGNLIKKWCLEKGVSVHTSTQVESIEQEKDKTLKVNLGKNHFMNVDLLILATGVTANIQFLNGSGVETDSGILVNNRLQSNIEDIYAAGDVCQGKDFSTGEYSVQAIQPTAVEHGRIAAMNMVGKETIHQGSINMNVLDTMGLISSSYGLWMGVDGGQSARLCDESRCRYLKLEFEDDILVGAQVLGFTLHVGVLRGLIQTRLKLGKWKDHLLKDPTRIMEAYLANMQPIGYNARIF